MSKSIDSVAVIVQARLGSQRVPQKMIRPFCGTTLFDLVLHKLTSSNIIPNKHIFASVYEKELVEKAEYWGVNIFNRSAASASEETDMKTIYEWHDKLPSNYKYVVLVSGCNPLLSLATIEKFYNKFITDKPENLFATIVKKTYYWDTEGKMLFNPNMSSKIMNTKLVEPVMEAAHCLYGSRLDIIKNNTFMVDLSKEKLNLIDIPELEAFDIDYEWQFKTAEILYEQI